MAGFFKKLFNRITGKGSEEVTPEIVEQLALPAPEEDLALPTDSQPETVVEANTQPKKIPAKNFEPEKTTPKKIEPAKVKAEKPEPKKTASKKPGAKKPEPKKTGSKKLEPKAAPRPTKTPHPTSSSLRKQRPSLPQTEKRASKLDPRLRGDDGFGSENVDTVKIAKVAPAPQAEVAAPQADLKTEIKTVAPAPIVAPATPLPPPLAEQSTQRAGWFSKLKEGLSKSSKSIGGSITSIFTKKKLDKATLQDLEDTLIQADLGLPVAERIIAAVSVGRYDKEIDPEEVKQILASEVAKVLKPVEVPFNFGSEKPFVIMVVGVNGSGKTTTIGKLGSIATGEGFKVMFAACDTFRAAAIEQLTVWGKRVGAETMSRPTGADSSGLAFDALKKAHDNGTDILFIDTAGRLQNKTYLMDELDKVVRVIKKLDPVAPHAVLLVLDATTGQNALNQVDVFTKVAGVTGLIMTKLDGTARGGILVAIAEKFKLPIHAIGVGESIDDLQPFDANGFARAIAGLDER